MTISPSTLFSLGVAVNRMFRTLDGGGRGAKKDCVRGTGGTCCVHSRNVVDHAGSVRRVIITGHGNVPMRVDSINVIHFKTPGHFKTVAGSKGNRYIKNVTVVLGKTGTGMIARRLRGQMRGVRGLLPRKMDVRPCLGHSRLMGQGVSAMIRGLVRKTVVMFIMLVVFLNGVHTKLVMTSIVPLTVLFTFVLVHVFKIATGLVDLNTVSFNVMMSNSVIVMRNVLTRLCGGGLGKHALSKARVSRRIRGNTSNMMHSTAFTMFVVLVMFFPVLALDKVRKGCFAPVTGALMFYVVKTLLLSLACMPVVTSLFLGRAVVMGPAFTSHFFRGLGIVCRQYLRFYLHFG